MEGTVKWRQGGWRGGERQRQQAQRPGAQSVPHRTATALNISNNISNMPHTQQAPVNKDPGGESTSNNANPRHVLDKPPST